MATSIPVAESSLDDLAVQRHLLDLALQPIDRFDGFDKIEQFGSSALRYQLNFITYALCMAQYTRTPAFTGYLAEAARNAIVKMTDKRVWSYWAAENLIGYARLDPDPIKKNNVMYTGFFGAMLGLYETMNDDRSLSEPGALTLHWNSRKSFPYDFAAIAGAIADNMRSKPRYPQYPCEPHLVYPMCNAYAIDALLMHDRIHGTDITGTLVEDLRTSYHRDGWIRKDGRWIGGGTRTGRQIFPPYLGNEAPVIYWLNAPMPDLARQTWEVVRTSCLHIGTNGSVDIKHGHLDRLDFGNYGMLKGDSYTRAALMMAAREMGDEDAADALANSLEERHEVAERAGARKYKGVSNWGNGIHALARFSRADGCRDLVLGNVPDEWRSGPILAEAGYPAVLVAYAVTDGEALDLVLRPGDGGGRTKLRIERLVPGRSYVADGAVTPTVQADAEGRALLEINLTDRLELQIRPIH